MNPIYESRVFRDALSFYTGNDNSRWACWDRYAKIVEQADVTANRVVDLFCGVGLLTKQLSFRYAEVVAFEPSPYGASFANHFFAMPPTCLGVTVLTKSQSIEPADACFCAWALQHMDGTASQRFADLAESVVRPEGHLVSVEGTGCEMPFGNSFELLRQCEFDGQSQHRTYRRK